MGLHAPDFITSTKKPNFNNLERRISNYQCFFFRNTRLCFLNAAIPTPEYFSICQTWSGRKQQRRAKILLKIPTITPEWGGAFSPARHWVLTWGCTRSCRHSICGGAGWGWWSSEPPPSSSYEISCLGSRSSQPCCCSESISSWCCWSEDGYLSTSGQKIYQFDIPAMKAWYTNWNQFHTSHCYLVFEVFKVYLSVEHPGQWRIFPFFTAWGNTFPFFFLFISF